MLAQWTVLVAAAALASAQRILNLDVGAECRALDGGRGSCQLLSGCRDPGDFRVEQPPICSFQGREPVICCPSSLVQRQSPGLRAAQYCRTISQTCEGSVPESSGVMDNFGSVQNSSEPTGLGLQSPEPVPQDAGGSRTDFAVYAGSQANPKVHLFMKGEDLTKVIPKNQPVLFVYLPRRRRRSLPVREVYHGVNSRPKSRTYMVLIGYGSESSKEWGCGGSLVTNKYVLSAAHCSAPSLLGEAKWARLGDLDLSTTKDDAKTQDREIVERIIHPRYREPQVYNDIALFRLDREVEFTPWVAPVCLHTQRAMPAPVATVTGWGRVDFAGETSDHLLEADLDVYNDTECQRLLPHKDSKTPRAIDTSIMFCAGKSDGTRDACSGDSGGPLVVKLSGQCLRTQIGITSYGNMCGLPDSPGVYTRVSHFISWIEDIVFPQL